MLLGTAERPGTTVAADGVPHDTSRDFVPNSIYGYGRPQLLNGLRLSKVAISSVFIRE